MDKIRILYFLEDRAQEGFIKAIVKRIAQDELESESNLSHEIRSGRGGSRVINNFKRFLRDYSELEESDIAFLVVAVDGNCHGYRNRIQQLENCIRSDHPFKNRVVYAVPDPHIERWYIMDQRAVKDGIGLIRAPELPPYKCRKGHYKQVLNRALRESNINSLFGGEEYAEQIVDSIQNLNTVIRQNAGFEYFIEELRKIFKSELQISS